MMIYGILITMVALALLKFQPALDKTSQGDILLWYTPLLGGDRKYIKL